MGKNRQERKKKVYEFFIKYQRPEEFAKDPQNITMLIGSKNMQNQKL